MNQAQAENTTQARKVNELKMVNNYCPICRPVLHTRVQKSKTMYFSSSETHFRTTKLCHI